MASKTEIIEMLKADMRDEHGALILYLKHAYYMGEIPESFEIEGAARDEMRHFKWLAQAIAQLGGEPNVDRTEMDLGGTSPAEWMGRDVHAETDAITQYEQHLAAIDDLKVKALIERILTDERAHHDLFAKLQTEVAGEVAADTTTETPAGDSLQPRVKEILDIGTRHEYTVILQYLLHSFRTGEDEASREWETIAVNEMQHLGWLAEYAAGNGHSPLLEADATQGGIATDSMLTADSQAEKTISHTYSEQIKELQSNPEMAGLIGILDRARQNEDFHAHMFDTMLARVEADKDPWQRPGVGKTQPSEPGKCESCEEVDDAGNKNTGFTVGSLIK